jgi:Tfp pilus assembly protein PilE
MEKVKKSKVIRGVLFGVILLAVLAALALGSYMYIYKEKSNEENTETSEQEIKRYPEQTIIEKNVDGSVKITPSKEDTVQIQDSEGEYVEVPKITPPN